MKKLLLAAILILAAGVAFAQDFKTGYFLDNYTYSYRINPGASLDGKNGTFIGVGLGNVSANVKSNLSISSFLNKDMDLLFFDSRVPMDEAIDGFGPDNSLLVNANVNLITFGKKTDTNRFSVEFNFRSDSFVNLPLDFISSSKRALEGLASGDWDNDFVFSGLQASANLYTEVAFGYTQKLGEAFTLGGRIKGLVGLADISANLDADVHLKYHDTPDEIVAGKLGGNVAIASPTSLELARYNNYYDLYLTDYDYLTTQLLKDNHRKVAGWGAAIDLGVTFEPFDGLSLSASVLDLGFIRWNSTVNGSFVFDKTIKTGEGGSNIGSEIFALEDSGATSYVSGLNYTFHAGAKYVMPFYERMNVGVIGTLQKYYKDIRLGVNVSPVDFLSIAASGALTTYGPDFGLALNLSVPFINFFVGTDAPLLPTGSIKTMKLNTLLTTGLVIVI